MGLISIMEKITTGPDILVSGRLGGGSQAIYDVFLKLWLGLGGGGALLSFGIRFRNIPEQNVPRSQLSLLPWELSVTQSGRLMGGPTRAGAVVSNSSLGVTRCINGLQGSPWYFNCEVSLSGTI